MVGDVLPDGVVLEGIRDAVAAAGSVFLVVSVRNTSFHFTRLYRLRDGAVEPVRVDDTQLRVDSPIAVNERGQIVLRAGRGGGTTLELVEDKRVTTIATLAGGAAGPTPSPAGGFFSQVGGLAIDDSGRVMASIQVRGGPSGAFLYSGGSWRFPAAPGGTIPQTENTRPLIVAAKDRFFGRFDEMSYDTYVAQLGSGDWEVVLPHSGVLLTGADGSR